MNNLKPHHIISPDRHHNARCFANCKSITPIECTNHTFKSCIFNSSHFDNLNLSGSTFIACHFNHAFLSYCDLSNCIFVGCSFHSLTAISCNIYGSDFSKSFQYPIPVIKNIKSRVLNTINNPETNALSMEEWHTCETIHCLAGWAIHLAGDDGYELEEDTSPSLAGALIWLASNGEVPDFHSSDEEALQWLKKK